MCDGQAELNKDKIAKEKAEKAIAARCEALKEQEAVRARVDAVADQYRGVLLAIRALARGARGSFVQYVMECESLVNKLLSNPLVCELARE